MVCIYCNIYIFKSSLTTSISTPMLLYSIAYTYFASRTVDLVLGPGVPATTEAPEGLVGNLGPRIVQTPLFFSMRGLNGTHFSKGIKLDTKMWLVILEGFRLESAWSLGWCRIMTPCILVVSCFKSSTFQKYFGSTYLRTLGILPFDRKGETLHHPAGFCCSLRCPGPGWRLNIR